MTNKELLDIQHMIESKIKKTNDRFTHVVVLFIAIGMFIWAMIYFLIPPGTLSALQSDLLGMAVIVSFLASVIFGVARLSPHKWEEYLENLENVRRKGALSQIDVEQFVARFLEETKPEE